MQRYIEYWIVDVWSVALLFGVGFGGQYKIDLLTERVVSGVVRVSYAAILGVYCKMRQRAKMLHGGEKKLSHPDME